MFIEVKDGRLIGWGEYPFSRTAVEIDCQYTGKFANGYEISGGQVRYPEPELSYRQKREAEYPSLGDMVDAFCKAAQGDEGELSALMEQRAAVKLKISQVNSRIPPDASGGIFNPKVRQPVFELYLSVVVSRAAI